MAQEFTWRSLNQLRKPRGQLRLTPRAGTLYPASSDEWRTFFEKLALEVSAGTFAFDNFFIAKHRNRTVIICRTLESEFVLRKLNENLRRAYGVKQANRTHVIAQTQQALRESVPKHVVRLDIKSFFESIDRRAIVRQLQSDRLISTKSLLLLEQLFEHLRPNVPTGLPRGISLSTTLAEIFLRRLDHRLRTIPGAYFVARYVDDIVLMSIVPFASIKNHILDVFESQALTVNWKKFRALDVQCRCARKCKHPGTCECQVRCKCKVDWNQALSFDFLGYKFVFPDVNANKGPNKVALYISDRKIAKMKTRIHRAVTEYRKHRDFSLLIDRIRFLTGNYRLDPALRGSSLRGGIYYNYQLYEPRPECDSSNLANSLLELDTFLRRAVASVLTGSNLTRAGRNELFKYSFQAGFANRRNEVFKPKRLTEVQACWTNV